MTSDASTQTAPQPGYLPTKPNVHCPPPQQQLYKGARPAKLAPGRTNPTGAITKVSPPVTYTPLANRNPSGGGSGRGGGSGVGAGGGGGGSTGAPHSNNNLDGASQARRKMVRGSVESRTNEPPPPH